MCPVTNVCEIPTVAALKILQSKDMRRTRKAQVKEEVGKGTRPTRSGPSVAHWVLSHNFSADSSPQNMAMHVTEEQGSLDCLV